MKPRSAFTEPENLRKTQSAAVDLYWAEGWLALYRYFEASAVLSFVNYELPEGWIDAGCGEGRFASVLKAGAKTYGSAVGVDSDPLRMNYPETKGAYSARIAATLDCIPLPSESAPLVVANSVLEHVPNIRPSLRELVRLLRPDGRLIVTMPTDAFEGLLAGSQALSAVGLRGAARAYERRMSRHIAHVNYMTPSAAVQLLQDHGLSVDGVEHFASPRFSAIGDLLHLVRIVGIGGSRFSKLSAEALNSRLLVSSVARTAKKWERRWIEDEGQRLENQSNSTWGMMAISARRDA